MTFSERLNAVLRKGNLHTTDAARLFGRPQSTVYGWVKQGLNPFGGPADIDAAYQTLAKLENYLQRSKLLPVPTGLSRTDRIRHVRRLCELLTATRS